jgi:hypothetical protein
MPTPSPMLTTELYQNVKLALQQINLKAQRLQTSTVQEIALRELQLRFGFFVDLVPGVKEGTTNRSVIDRDWKSCNTVDIPKVRAFVQKSDPPPVVDPVAQIELKAIIDSVTELNKNIVPGNWGMVETLCSQLQLQILEAIQECRRVTDSELREIFTITRNMNL